MLRPGASPARRDWTAVARLLAVVALATLPGCGLGLLQTARTTPRGTTDVVVGGGYVHNEMVEERGGGIANVTPVIAVRHGFTDRLDVGASLLFFTGVLLDAKVALLPPGRPLALSVQAGGGVAQDVASGAKIRHIPVRVLVSRDVGRRPFVPYGALGYSAFWIRDYYVSGDVPPPEARAARAGHGDGVVALTVGVEMPLGTPSRFLLEYAYWIPVLDDPGDDFSFSANHVVQAGLAF